MSKIQYTIRNIPPAVDQVIHKRAKQSGKSFNQTVVDLLTLQTFGTEQPPKQQNFDFIFGKGKLDAAYDEAIADQSRIDEALWR